MTSDCENCIHKIRKLSKYGEIYACEKWVCKPEYKEDKDDRREVWKINSN